MGEGETLKDKPDQYARFANDGLAIYLRTELARASLREARVLGLKAEEQIALNDIAAMQTKRHQPQDPLS